MYKNSPVSDDSWASERAICKPGDRSSVIFQYLSKPIVGPCKSIWSLNNWGDNFKIVIKLFFDGFFFISEEIRLPYVLLCAYTQPNNVRHLSTVKVMDRHLVRVKVKSKLFNSKLQLFIQHVGTRV